MILRVELMRGKEKADISTLVLVKGRVKYAPLAQLVEHLTLNQGVQGSSP